MYIETSGKRRKVRALIDTGSQRSYILKKTANEMGYTPVGSESLIHTLFRGATSQREDHQCYDINLRSLTSDYAFKIQVLDQPVICGPVGRLKSSSWIGELRERGVQLSDVGGGQPRVEILTGADVAGKLYTGNMFELRCGLVAVQTWLGCVIMGKAKPRSNCSTHAAMLTTLLIQTSNN